MSVTDALTITSAPDALTRYYNAKEREESAVLYINDAYLEALNSLENLEAENAKLRELVKLLVNCVDRISNEDTFYYQPRRDGCGFDCTANGEGCSFIKLCKQARDLGVEVDDGSR